MKLKSGIFFLVLLAGTTLHAQEKVTITGEGRAQDMQEKVSLQQCLNIALDQNHTLRQAILGQKIAREKTREVKSDLLPQINISGYWTDNLSRPVIILPGDIIGQPGQDIPVELTPQYDMGASLELSQVLFNPALFAGIKIAKNGEELAKLRNQYTKEEVIYNVAIAFYDILHTGRQINCMERNLSIQDSLFSIVEQRVKQDIAREIDRNRIKVGITNLNVKKKQLYAFYDQQMNYFNVLLGLPVDIRLGLDDKLLEYYPPAPPTLNNRTELSLLNKEKRHLELNKKMINRQYLPSLAFIASGGYQYLSENMKLNNSSWYDYSMIGVRLSIPLFDGFKKHRQNRQMSFSYMQMYEKIQETEKTIEVEFLNAKMQLEVMSLAVSAQNENLNLADKIYRQSLLLYKEGLYSITDLLQTETAYQETQSAYWTEVNNHKKAMLDVMKAGGNLEQLIKQ